MPRAKPAAPWLGLLAVRKVRDILGDLLSQLLADSPEPELMRIHDKYADRSFADEQQQQFDAMRRTAAQKKSAVQLPVERHGA